MTSVNDKVTNWHTSNVRTSQKHHHNNNAQILVVDGHRKKKSNWLPHLPDNSTPRCGAGVVKIGQSA